MSECQRCRYSRRSSFFCPRYHSCCCGKADRERFCGQWEHKSDQSQSKPIQVPRVGKHLIKVFARNMTAS